MPDLNKLIELQTKMLEEQRKTNHLLLLLVDALANEQDGDNTAQPVTYLSGKPNG